MMVVKTKTFRSTSHVNFKVNLNIFKEIWLCISWINKRLYSIKMHGATVKKKVKITYNSVSSYQLQSNVWATLHVNYLAISYVQ